MAAPHHVPSLPDPGSDQELTSESTEDEIFFEDWDRLRRLVQDQLAEIPDASSHWTLVTYGLGLVELGRRDARWNPRNPEELPAILRLWGDHSLQGDLVVYLVCNQPRLELTTPYVAFIVTVEIPNLQVPPRRATLIHELGEDCSALCHRPKPAWVTPQMTPHQFLFALDLADHCFPYGVRDCAVACRGVILTNEDEFAMAHGDYCQVHIGPYPAEINRLAAHLYGAEDMHRDIRHHCELSHVSILTTRICLEVHGISLFNQPLGMQTVHVASGILRDQSWISQIRHLWPFADDNPEICYVHSRSISPTATADCQLRLTFIVNYCRRPNTVPVLIQQTMTVLEPRSQHVEAWAIAIHNEASGLEITDALPSPPFWVYPNVPCIIKYAGHCLDHNPYRWQIGAFLQMDLVVEDLPNALASMLETRDTFCDEVDDSDEVSSVQLSKATIRSIQ